MDINNKVVLVTGASRGIGMAIATELSDKGAFVIGTATSNDCLLYTSDAADE